MSANTQIDAAITKFVHCKARQLVGRAGITRSDVPDIEQDLLVDLLERLPHFNGDKATRATFVARVVENRISKILRHRLAEMRSIYRESCSLDDTVEGENENDLVPRHETISADQRRTQCDAARDPVKHQDMQIDLAEVIGKLPERLRVICEHLQSHTPAETARLLGIPRATLYDRIHQIRAIFAGADLQNYL